MNRQESLFAILPRAVEAAKECQIAVLYAPAYVDDYNEGVHVYCPMVAIDILYPARAAWERLIDAVVEKDGSVFFTRAADVLESIKRNKAKFVRIEVEPEVFDKVAESLHEKKPICPNCGQWQHPKGDILDCLNDCATRGFAPKVKATIWNSDGTDGPVLICPPDKPTWDKIEGGGEQ